LNTLDIHRIIEALPHRYPFLLVDRVLDYRLGEWLQAVKNVSVNEPFFPGHFPGRPVMPGVLILESMAQATGILAVLTGGGPRTDMHYYFVGIDKTRFKRPVEPGDQLVMDVTLKRHIRGMWMFNAEAKVDGTLAATAEIMCAMKEAGA
jgi:3-hydroxyacyl-[acyl-carrier-protein] dehydratase